MVTTTELYLGSHVHEIVENERGGLQGSPATSSQRVWEAHAICMFLPFLLWCAGTRGRGQQTCVYKLDVAQPRQQVGQHYLPTIGMSGRKSLADLCAYVKKKKKKKQCSQSTLFIQSYCSGTNKHLNTLPEKRGRVSSGYMQASWLESCERDTL